MERREKEARYRREDFARLLRHERRIEAETTWEEAVPWLEPEPEWKELESLEEKRELFDAFVAKRQAKQAERRRRGEEEGEAVDDDARDSRRHKHRKDKKRWAGKLVWRGGGGGGIGLAENGKGARSVNPTDSQTRLGAAGGRGPHVHTPSRIEGCLGACVQCLPPPRCTGRVPVHAQAGLPLPGPEPLHPAATRRSHRDSDDDRSGKRHRRRQERSRSRSASERRSSGRYPSSSRRRSTSRGRYRSESRE